MTDDVRLKLMCSRKLLLENKEPKVHLPRSFLHHPVVLDREKISQIQLIPEEFRRRKFFFECTAT